MRYRILVLLAVAAIATRAMAEEKKPADPPDRMPPIEVDENTAKVLEEINSVNAYQTPKLPLKQDDRYAHTTEDLTPFRHVEPFKRYFLEQMEYTGPGRAIPEPEDVKTVRIGFLGPIEPTVSVATGGKSHGEYMGRQMLHGAQLAIEQANAGGGYLKRKVPFELVISNDNGLWGASGEQIIKLAYREKVWAILGSIDGANSHIAIRVGLKIEIPIMNSGDTDPTFIETNIPWVLRCIGDDRQQSYLLCEYIYRKAQFHRVGVVRASNRYGRFGIREIRDASRRLGKPIPMEMAYFVGQEDFGLQIERLKEAKAEAIVHWGDAADGARLLKQMRAAGMNQPFFACDRCLLEEFTRIAGEDAEGVVCGSPWNPRRDDPKLDAFREAYRQRFAEEPETYAAHAFDGMNMLIWAIQVAGLNRAKVRDVLAYRTVPWPGVTGEIPLSSCLDDAGEVFLAKRESGVWNYYSHDELEIPSETIATQQAASEPQGK